MQATYFVLHFHEFTRISVYKDVLLNMYHTMCPPTADEVASWRRERAGIESQVFGLWFRLPIASVDDTDAAVEHDHE